MDPGVRGCLAGRRHGLSAADLTALGAALRTSSIPCSTPSVAQGARWKLWSGALTRLRPQVPSRPPAEPCFPSPPGVMDHPLEVARQRLQVDGKPHPTAPSHPQAPKPVGALQLGVCPLYPGPYGIPLRHSSVASARRRPSMFTFTRSALRTAPARRSSFTGQRRKGQGSHVALAKWTSTRSGASSSSYSSTDRCPAGHTVACSPVTSIWKSAPVSGGGPSPSPSWEFPGADPLPPGSPVPSPGARPRRRCGPTHTPCPRRARPVGPSAPPARQPAAQSRRCRSRWMGSPLHE